MTFPDIAPEIFSISIWGFEFALRWYAVSYLAGFFAAYIVMREFVKREHLWPYSVRPMETSDVEAIIFYLILGVVIGGRLGYVIFYNLEYYYADPWSIPKLWDGGMSFHGGFLGVILALVFYCRRNGILLLCAADLIAISSGPGVFFGRVANFINAELYGRPTDVPWGVVFPGTAAQNCPGVVGLCARHPSQLYEAGFEGAFMFLLLVGVAFRGALKRPGAVTSLFFIVYGVSRYVIEFYRVPDRQFFSPDNPYGFAYAIGDFGVTMGQALCIPMILVGLILILTRRRLDRGY